MIPAQKDLIVLVTDNHIKAVMEGLLSRQKDLGIKSIDFDIFFYNIGHDPGCFKRCHEYLRSFTRQYAYALVIFDFEGCGVDSKKNSKKKRRKSREFVEQDAEKRLAANGWEKRSAAVALDPEIEIWVWSDSPMVEKCLEWKGPPSGLKDWLVAETDFWDEAALKPHRPKEAMIEALRKVRKPQSSSIFSELAKTVPLSGCVDKSFEKFRQTLQKWFILPQT